MPNGTLVVMTEEQLAGARLNLENINKLIKNGAAFIDAGVMTQDDLNQAIATKELTEKMIATYSANKK